MEFNKNDFEIFNKGYEAGKKELLEELIKRYEFEEELIDEVIIFELKAKLKEISNN